MGRRSSSKKSNNNKRDIHGLSPQNRMQLSQMVDQLFYKCNVASSSGSSTTASIDEYIEIYKLVEQIRIAEKDIKLPAVEGSRTDQIEPFLKWLDTINSKFNGLKIVEFEGEGFGLETTREIESSEEVIVVPSSAILSEESAEKSYLGPLLKSDPILKHMRNVSLSLHLLAEYVDPNSKWRPYLQMLPLELSTTLYFTPEQTKLLKCSQIQEESVKLYHSIARQYSYFYRILQKSSESKTWPIREYFSFDSYRWAVATVMTRLNRIPSTKSPVSQLALIPAWDMANHEFGNFSTDFDDDTNDVRCFAYRKFVQSEQFKIYYGPRSNAEFYVHNGFVYRDNPDDSIALKVGVSKNDPLYSEKASLLSILRLPPNGSFPIVAGKQPISPGLLAFARIFCMNKDSIGRWMLDSGKLSELQFEDVDVGVEQHDKTWKFLHTRISLIYARYPTTLEDDEALLPSLPNVEMQIRLFLIEEKKLLKNAIDYLKQKIDK